MALVFRQLLLWTFVCCVSAAPSFVLALDEYDATNQILAMLAGVAFFITGYTVVSCTPWARQLRRGPFVLATLRIGYGTRMGLSAASLVAFPLMVVPDIYFGYFSIEFVKDTLRLPDGSTRMVFLTTIVEGILWNLAILLLMAVVYGIQRVVRKPSPLSGLCQKCGYDLRASTGICPECGTQVPQVSA